MPSSSDDLRDAILAALRTAGRPLTRGEFHMFRGFWFFRAREIQAALDALETDGLVVGRDAVISVRHLRGRWTRATRLYAPTAEEVGHAPT